MKNILIIDDDLYLRITYEDLLSMHGYHVLSAGNKKEASLKMKVQKIDLIILDYFLEDTTGIDALAEIRETSPDIPVIIISGYPDPRVIANAKSQGIEDFIVKPIKTKHFLSRIEKVFDNLDRKKRGFKKR